MNSKGFTLVELIATIGIMALIGLVIMNNMTGLFSKREDEDYLDFVSKLEESACMYVEVAFTTDQRNNCKASGCVISVDQLINRGYIDEKLIDPNTGGKVTSNKEKYKVHVSWINNVKTCKMNG